MLFICPLQFLSTQGSSTEGGCTFHVRSSEYKGYRKQKNAFQQHFPWRLTTTSALLWRIMLCTAFVKEKARYRLKDCWLAHSMLPTRKRICQHRGHHFTATSVHCQITKWYKFDSDQSWTHNSDSVELTRIYISEFMLSGLQEEMWYLIHYEIS